MEPLHMTEFGSDRYLEKFNQSEANSATSAPPTAGISQSQFILPLRGSNLSEADALLVKPIDQNRSEKKSFGFFRSKFHAKSSAPATSSSHAQPEPRPSSTYSTSTRKR
jgi:hypothetical protein